MLGNIFIFIISLILGVGVFIGYQQFFGHLSVAPPSKQTAAPAPTISFALGQAPKNAFVGTIVSMEGKTLWESRVATEPAELNEKISLQQGEKITTGDGGSMTVDFSEIVEIDLEENTQLNLTQTLPANIVITQESGTATYVLTPSDFPVSVRINRLLVRLKRGETQISLNKETSIIEVDVRDGCADVAYNDASFTSQRTTVSKNQTFTFNNDTRKGTLE